MPRSRQRICLQEGLKLDISWLARRGLIAPGSATGPHAIRWMNSNGEVIASGWISADMRSEGRCSTSRLANSTSDHPGSLASPLWRPTVVFAAGNEPSRIGFMAASRGAAVRKQARLARAGRLQIAIHDADGSGLSRQGKDQAASDRRA